MEHDPKVTNIVIAGLGGEGVLKASDIIAEVAFRAGLDVKKSEVHGMSQRGGSVTSNVRFGGRVYSPMVPPREANYLLVLSPDQLEPNRWRLAEHGALIVPDAISAGLLRDKRSLNVALLGVLSLSLPFPKLPGRRLSSVICRRGCTPPTSTRSPLDAPWRRNRRPSGAPRTPV